MKIWYISKYARPERYGMATRHFSLAKEFNRKNHETIVITSDSQPKGNFPKFKKIFNTLILDEVKTIIIRTKKFNSSNSKKRILSWIDFELKLLLLNKKIIPRPDVIIVSSLSLFTIINGLLYKKKYNAKLVLEIRDIWPKTLVDLQGFSPGNLFIRILSWIEKIGYQYSDIIVSTLPNLEAHVMEVLRKNKNVYCIPQGYDLEILTGGEILDMKYINKYIPKNKFIIGYAGAVGASNALETFFDTIFKMRYNKEIHFVVLGWGDKLEYFKKITSELNNISFIPTVSKNQVFNVLDNCNVLYDSVKKIDLYKFGLSRNKWIDYMFAGKPIIVSYSGYQSMINEAGCGAFIEPENPQALKNKILEFKNLDLDKLNELGMNGRKWLLANRSYNKLASNFLEILN